MTKRCELCGRAYARGAVAPAWYRHKNVCDRRGCRDATADAVLAIATAREVFDDLVTNITARCDDDRAQYAPCGYRQDTMAQMDADGEDWWALSIAKDTEKP